ncbi:MAG: hypothetical protein EXR93_02395 [Gemmatimonadetes bacterium]|nr:hypothetical protein [Gemmatimonadota bacterium]
MKHAGGLSLVLALLAGPAVAQGGGGMGRGGPPPADHWVSADSLVKALGITDASVSAKVAPHLAEVDKILKTAADERAKMMGGGGPPDPAVRQAMMGKMTEWQAALDGHYGAVRAALPAASQAAFDALQKPALRRPGGPGGRMGGGPPGQ